MIIFLYKEGVIPNCSLKHFLKYFKSLKPSSKETSETVSSFCFKSSADLRSLTERIIWLMDKSDMAFAFLYKEVRLKPISRLSSGTDTSVSFSSIRSIDDSSFDKNSSSKDNLPPGLWSLYSSLK